MRKLIVSMNLTLDGLMSGPNGELDWHFQSWTQEMAEFAAEILATADTILLGRVTYCAMAAYWGPRQIDLHAPREDIDFANMMNHHTKIVLSSTLRKTEWNNSFLLRGNTLSEIAGLKRKPGKNIIIYGSGRLVNSLIPSGQVDEYQFWIHPVILGQGRPLFPTKENKQPLKLLRSIPFDSGVVLLIYCQDLTRHPFPESHPVRLLQHPE